MGVNLTPIIIKKRILALKDLAGKTLAIDANNALHQFLSITRMADGSPFTDGHGNVTSHLIGLLFRSTALSLNSQSSQSSSSMENLQRSRDER